MNHTYRGIFNLIRSGLTGTPCPLPADFHIADAEELIVKHQVVGLVYEGAVVCGIPKNDPVMVRLFQQYYRLTICHNGQMAAVDKLFSVFDANGIDYLPVKGCILKSLYPHPAARAMGDADILIRVSQQEQIVPLVKELGYTPGIAGTVDWAWNSKHLHLELHTALVPYYATLEHNFFQDVWDRAVKGPGHRYDLTCEDAFLFIFAHYARHYRNSGIGIRQPIDLWVWQQKFPEMDMEQVYAGLEALHLTEFFHNTQKMLAAWFDDSIPPDDRVLFMTEYIFSSGSWGHRATSRVSSALRFSKAAGSGRKGRRQQFLFVAFPPLENMRIRYPVLRKAPWLLPLFWPVRWIDAALFRRKNLQKVYEDYACVTCEELLAREQELQYVGLDFYSE